MVLKALWDMHGVTPRQADDLLIWEIALMLGCSDELATPEEKVTTTPGKTQRVSVPGRSHDEVNRRLIKQRYAHAAGLGPKPEPPPVSLAALMALSGTGVGQVVGRGD